MAGYHGKIITRQFDELSDGPDDKVWVTVRNPRTMSPDQLRPKRSGLTKAVEAAVDAGFTPDAAALEDAEVDEAMSAGNEVCSRLIIGWHVWDPTVPIVLNEDGEIDESACQPRRLPSPPTPADVAKAPLEIHEWLGEVLSAATPTQATTTEAPEAGISNPS